MSKRILIGLDVGTSGAKCIAVDETGAVLRTGLGMLALDGEDLHVVKLDLSGGSLKIEGKINGLFYSDAGNGKKAAKRLFR